MRIRTTAGIGSATRSRRYAWDESHGAAGRWRSGAGLVPALITTLKVGPIRPGHRGFDDARARHGACDLTGAGALSAALIPTLKVGPSRPGHRHLGGAPVAPA
jgi:hypothetical protein